MNLLTFTFILIGCIGVFLIVTRIVFLQGCVKGYDNGFEDTKRATYEVLDKAKKRRE